MDVHSWAGTPPPPELPVNVPRLVTAYFIERPDPSLVAERVSFGTSGHRGSSLKRSFNEHHVLAIAQAVCEYRRSRGTDGPLFVGIDTHALSEPAFATVVEVLAANEVSVRIDRERSYTPTPVISHAILTHNRGRGAGQADGIVVTPSHNPPDDGGIKYNPPHGGPAEASVTGWIEQRANELLEGALRGVRRMPFASALASGRVALHDYMGPFVADLEHVVDMEVIRESGIALGVDPMGGASVFYWDAIAERYGLGIKVTSRTVDPTFAFMPVDYDGKIRMDCSSPYAMRRLIDLAGHFDVAFGNDPDCDRHGIVTRKGGLMKPNDYLAVAVRYLFENRPSFPSSAAVGKTIVTSAMIDRVAAHLGRAVVEVPVGFKWFVEGLLDARLAFAGEESAGASFLRRDGTVWTTDKDGIIADLLAAEIRARTGRDPAEHYARLTEQFGQPLYARIDAPATREQKQALGRLSAGHVRATAFAGEPIVSVMTTAPGNSAPIGGIKVVTENGWFAARPSGTEDVYKVYAESFKGPEHLRAVQEEAQRLVAEVIGGA